MKIKITPWEYEPRFFGVYTKKLGGLIDLSDHLIIYAEKDLRPRIKFYSNVQKIDIEKKTGEKNTINYGRR
jgi:hypothetical protein